MHQVIPRRNSYLQRSPILSVQERGAVFSSAPASQEPQKNGRNPAVGQASLFASDSDSTRNGSSATTLTLSTNSDIRAFLTTMGQASGSRPESRQSMDVENAAQGETKDTDSSEELTEEEQAQVDELQKRDQEVRQHEQAHLAAGWNSRKWRRSV